MWTLFRMAHPTSHSDNLPVVTEGLSEEPERDALLEGGAATSCGDTSLGDKLGDGRRGVGCLLRLGRRAGATLRTSRSEIDENERVLRMGLCTRGDTLWLIRLSERGPYPASGARALAAAWRGVGGSSAIQLPPSFREEYDKEECADCKEMVDSL